MPSRHFGRYLTCFAGSPLSSTKLNNSALTKPLGRPLSAAQELSPGFWVRKFASGTTATWNMSSDTGTVHWAGDPPSPTPPSPSPSPSPPPKPSPSPRPSPPLPQKCGVSILNIAFKHRPSLGSQVVNSAAECCALCKNNSKCTVWSWWREKDRECHLQTNKAIPKNETGCVSGRLSNQTIEE